MTDLKPENVFLAKPRRAGVTLWVELLDFGIAKILSDSLTVAVSSRMSSLGTPMWMAPEQTDGRAAVTAAADIWALGLLTFFLLTGQPYWRAAHGAREPTLGKLLREVLTERIDPASSRAAEYGLGGRIPAGFDVWFERCVARRPEARFAAVQDAVSALREILAERTPEPPVPQLTEPRELPDPPVPPMLRMLPSHPGYAALTLPPDPAEPPRWRVSPWWLVTAGALALCLVMLVVALLSPARVLE